MLVLLIPFYEDLIFSCILKWSLLYTVVAKSLRTLVKNLCIMAVFSSNDFYSAHISVMEWAEHKQFHEVWFNNEFILGLLKMWPNPLAQKYTYSNCDTWLNVSWPFSPELSAQLLAEFLTTPLDRINKICWLPGKDLYHQHGPNILYGVEVKTLGGPSQNLNSSLIDPFLYHFWCVFGIILPLEHPTAAKTKSSGWWLQVFLKNLEIILLLHYSIYFLESSRSSGSKTAPLHNTTSTMLDSRYGVLGVKGFTFSPLKISLLIVAKKLNVI